MSIARVLDCDGTLTDLSGGTLLERLMMDYYEQQPFILRANLAIRSLGVKSYKFLAQAIRKFSDDSQMTGETNSLKLFDVLMLRRAGITTSFLGTAAAEYAKLIKPEYLAAIRNCKEDIYIVSSEPKQLLEAVLIHAGIADNIRGVYGTRFEIVDGVIKKFDRSELVAGISGKHAGMADIVSNGYSKVYAIGDSTADIGLFKTFRRKVVPYTFNDASPELVEYVRANNGRVVKNLGEFFSSN